MLHELKNFNFWCQKVLPCVFDESLSFYEVLSKMVVYINEMIENEEDFDKKLSNYGVDIKQLKKDVNFLKNEVEKVRDGGYVSLYLESIKKWIDKNVQNLVADIVKYVFFGLDECGHFIAYIPDSWDFLTFNTIANPDNVNYGKLMLEW